MCVSSCCTCQNRVAAQHRCALAAVQAAAYRHEPLVAKTACGATTTCNGATAFKARLFSEVSLESKHLLLLPPPGRRLPWCTLLLRHRSSLLRHTQLVWCRRRRYAAVVVLELDDGMLLALLNLYVFKCNEVSVLYTAACQPNALARSFSFGAPACSD